LRPGRIAPSLPNRRADEAIEAMRAAMGRREREELAIDQVGRELAPVERASVPGEAAAEVIERAQRQQLALALDGGPTMLEPVPDVLRAVRGLEPLWAVAHRIGVDAQGREAIERPARRWPTFRAKRSWNGSSDWMRCSRYAFGQPPGGEPPGRGDYRQRDAWKEVHKAAAKALEIHPGGQWFSTCAAAPSRQGSRHRPMTTAHELRLTAGPLGCH
jgi:hypothetical protein